MKTTATAEIMTANTSTNAMPEFGRWQDVKRIFGIKRGTLYNLWAEGKIKSVSVRRKGNLHGCRLFHLASISIYLNRLLSDQDKVANDAEQPQQTRDSCNQLHSKLRDTAT